MPTQAILVHQFGGPEVLELQSLPTPQAAAGQAVVRLEYAGINFVDLYQREGRYPNISLPWRLGLEGAGEIVDIAPGAEFQVGDRVAFTTGVQGAYASHLAVPLEHLVRVPDALALRQIHQLTGTDKPPSKRVTERFQRDLEADLVAEAEAVDHRLRHAVHLHVDALEFVVLDAFMKMSA